MRSSRSSRIAAQPYVCPRCRPHVQRPATPIRYLPTRGYATEVEQDGKKRKRKTKELSLPAEGRFNQIGVQQLSSHIHPQVFPGSSTTAPNELVDLSKNHLKQHELLGKTQESAAPVAFDVPDLFGKSLDEHFYKLGMDSSEPYLSFAKKFARANGPPRPRKWVARSGWTKYYRDGTSEPVDAPNEEMITFDTEVMWKETSFACMAVACSQEHWYAWLSPWLLEESESDRHLIPLGNVDQPRIVIGHNIGYDRARIREEYDVKQTKNFFIDTMSLHVASNGMCSRQRPTWVKHRKDRELRDQIAASDESADLNALLESGGLSDEEEDLWVGRSSVNSLRDVAQFHCGITIDKARREYFGELDRAGVREKLDELLDYCAADVDITHRVYKKVFPLFIETCQHPVSFGALRFLSQTILPVDKSWDSYIHDAESTYHKLSDAVQQRLADLATKALEHKADADVYQNDPWLSQLDWSGQEVKYLKLKKGEEQPRMAARQKKPGMPQWYKDLFATSESTDLNLTVRTRIAPLLLRLSWDGHPLFWSDKYGWTFRVPVHAVAKYNQTMQECDMDDEKDASLRADWRHKYFKLPHKDGPQARVASPLAKSFLQYFENGRLSSEYSYAKEALEMNASCSYWISARDRIMSQMAVYPSELPTADGNTVPTKKKAARRSKKAAAAEERTTGFILPQLIPMGTITRRAVENTWLTASNAKKNRVGSELKSMIKAPPGYCFVGADVDSQELWIASLIGDAQFKLHGGNALGFMTLEGSKAAGTDLHSRTASILGISRNDAKVFNYGRIYGAGLPFARTLLRQFNPTLSENDAAKTAQDLYTNTKGRKTTRRVLRDRPFWRGGTESLVFNALEDFAERERPRTPVLGAGITEALMKRYLSKGGFLTSRINWAIQSSGVDYLHLLIISMDYLSRRYAIDARLAITVHDEIRYLVKDSDKYRAAMALQVANLWTRAMFAQQMGMNELPQSVAFFSAIDIDHVLRKEVDMDCITPSNLVPIPHGESLDINQLLAKGKDAMLDNKVKPKAGEKPNPARFEYTPRVPVMAEEEGKIDPKKGLAYLKAQITSDDDALREVLKSLNPSKSAGPLGGPKRQDVAAKLNARATAKPRAKSTPSAQTFLDDDIPQHLHYPPQTARMLPVDHSWGLEMGWVRKSSAGDKWQQVWNKGQRGGPGRTWYGNGGSAGRAAPIVSGRF